MTTVHLKVHGYVQGVGFRYCTRRLAHEMGINGWVRNCPDGTVEIEAEGSKDVLDDFINQIKNGPGMSRVADIDIQYQEQNRNYDSFEITF